MDPRIGEAVFLLGLICFVAIRVPHDRRRREAGFRPPRLTAVERAVLALVFLGVFALPLLAVFTPWLHAADYSANWICVPVGGAGLVASLWLFHRAHADLGRNWSPLLQLRGEHELVVSGVYRRVRHPMYASFLLYGAAQALLLANWIAGPSFLLAAALMFATRLCVEERMMIEQFGQSYRDYAARTKRLIPGVW